MEGAEPLPRHSLPVLPKLTTALPLITKGAQHPKNTHKKLFRQAEKAKEVFEKVKPIARVKLDDSDNSPGWKFSEYEMKGVPLRLELGPKDIEKNQCVLVRRDTREKIVVSLDELETAIPQALQAVHDGLYEKAMENRKNRTWDAHNWEEFKSIAAEKSGFIRAMWCGDEACEDKIKDETGLKSRCIPFGEEPVGETCVCCGRPAKKLVYWGRQY